MPISTHPSSSIVAVVFILLAIFVLGVFPQPALAQPNKGVEVLRKTVVNDAGVGNMPAYSMLVPKSFIMKAGVKWDPTSRWSYANFVGSITNPDNKAELHFHPLLPFEFLQMDGMPEQRHGARIAANGSYWMPLPQNADELARKVIMPMVRPDARQIEFVTMEDFPEAAKVRMELVQPQIDDARRQDEQKRQMGMPVAPMQISFYCQRIRVGYALNKVSCYEDFYFTMQLMFFHTPALGHQPANTLWRWSLLEIKSIRTPGNDAETIDNATPVMIGVAASLRTTPEYAAVMKKFGEELNQQDFRAAAQRMEQHRRNAAELARINASTYTREQTLNDRLQGKIIDAIQGVKEWSGNDGYQYALPQEYGIAWQNNVGDIYVTNDALFNPGVSVDPGQTWTQLERRQ